MIEKIMKAVKSGNKKRGRNITIGAVVGMLLSCTVAMGAGEIGLEIGNSGSGIEFSKDGAEFVPGNESDPKKDPYLDNSWEKGTYTNNTIITGENGSGEAHGIKLSGNLFQMNFINNGFIKATGSNGNVGIYIDGVQVGDITNNGIVAAIGNNKGNLIYITNSSQVGDIVNNGILNTTGKGDSSVIFNAGSSQMGNITNNGIMSTYISGATYNDGIYFGATQENLVNTGIISANGAKGSALRPYTSSVGDITNSGILYGESKAINNMGMADLMDNYGILATKGNKVITHDGGSISSENNYGLYITEGTGKVTIDSTKQGNDIREIVVGYDKNGNAIKRNMIVKNAELEGTSGSATSTKTITFSGTENYNNHVLNGKDKTITVSGSGEISDSIINAYGTAVTFDNAGGSLTLSGTTVNGGIDGTSKVILGGNGDDTLTLKNGTIINGIIDGGGTGDSDTLNFGETGITKARAASSSDEIRIQHDILNYETINVNSNVTFYEKTVDGTGNIADLKVTGASEINIGANGVLTLRIDSTNIDNTSGTDKIIGHALYGNSGVITSANGGKLMLALNGAGNDSIISFGATKLGEGFVTSHEGEYQEDVTFETTSLLHSIKKVDLTDNEVTVTVKINLPSKSVSPDDVAYEKLNEIYHSIISVEDLIGNFNVDSNENLSLFMEYLNSIYAGNPYSYSSELSRKSAGMFRDIVTENIFRPEKDKWMIYGGLTHVDGGTKDTYYGKGYYTYDIGSSDMDADTKITGAYMLGEYGVSDTLSSGVVIGGNKLKSDLSNGSKVDGSAMYLGAYAKKYIGNLKVTAGAGFQYGDYDADRLAVNRVASDSAEPVMKYSDNYNDITYDIYLNGRYSHNIGNNLFLEPYATLSYTYIDQDGANEESKTLAIETDSKSFDYTVGKVGVDLKKVIPHEKGKSTLSAGVSYTKILDGADEEHITGRFKGGSNFDILVAHKNEHNIGLNVKYALELENGILFDVKGTYSVERDSHNNSGKNRTKGEWIVGAGVGYKF